MQTLKFAAKDFKIIIFNIFKKLDKRVYEHQNCLCLGKAVIYFKLYVNLKTEMKCMHSLNKTVYYNTRRKSK